MPKRGHGGRPEKRRSAAQQEWNASVGCASQAWEYLTDEQRLTWNVAASARRTTGQRYFVQDKRPTHPGWRGLADDAAPAGEPPVRHHLALLSKARPLYRRAPLAADWQAHLHPAPAGVRRRARHLPAGARHRSWPGGPGRTAKKALIPMEILWKSYGHPMEYLWNITRTTGYRHASNRPTTLRRSRAASDTGIKRRCHPRRLQALVS